MKQFFTALKPGNISSGGQAPPPTGDFDDTRELRLKSYLYEDRYYFTGGYHRNPTNGVILHPFHNGTSHVWEANKKFSAVRSTDGGETHSAVFDIYDPEDTAGGANLGGQDTGGNYDSNGRFHKICDIHGNITSPTAQHQCVYLYSDDDGETWSEPRIIFDAAGTQLWRMRTMGELIENNGVLLKPYYRGDGNEYRRYVLRSEDYGDTWDQIEVDTSIGSINEGSLIAHGNQILYAARKEIDDKGFRFCISNDNGLTWSVQGETAFGETIGKAHPPYMTKFKIQGQDVLCFYLFNRSSLEYMGIYGKPADVFAGISGWNLNTKTVFFDVDSAFFETPTGSEPGSTSGYAMVNHVNGDLFAKGMVYADYTNESAIVHYDLPTTHYQLIKSELNIN